MKIFNLNSTTAKVMIGILGTGAILNLAGSGKLGTTAQKAARYVTEGYGI